MIISNKRSIILAYNTVERLLKGDFFHFSKVEELVQEMEHFDKKWPVIGLGTTNWFKRNGEAIVEGNTENPEFLWADPDNNGKIINLGHEHPDHEENLKSPVIGPEDSHPQFPFMAIAMCDPNELQEYTLPTGENMHLWIEKKFASDNIGLAALHITGKLDEVKSTAACYIPIGGLKLKEGYSQKDNFKLPVSTYKIKHISTITLLIERVRA